MLNLALEFGLWGNRYMVYNVRIATVFSVFYWIVWGGLSLLFVITFPIVAWYYFAVVRRKRFEFREGDNRITYVKGGWFVSDDDSLPLRAIDNVKIDRSLLGAIFGWCTIRLETRSENYKLSGVSQSQSQSFRTAILDALGNV